MLLHIAPDQDVLSRNAYSFERSTRVLPLGRLFNENLSNNSLALSILGARKYSCQSHQLEGHTRTN